MDQKHPPLLYRSVQLKTYEITLKKVQLWKLITYKNRANCNLAPIQDFSVVSVRGVNWCDAAGPASRQDIFYD